MSVVRDEELDLDTPDGRMRVFVSQPADGATAPGVVMFMDAVGYREELRELARCVARRGYSCWLPDLYYRDGGPSFNVYTPKQDLERFAPLMRKVTRDVVLKDTTALLSRMRNDTRVAAGPMGCVGFCMGGRLALWSAAAFADDFAAAASLHGGQLGTESPESPHRYAPRMRCEVYLGFASDDPLVPAEHVQTIERALRQADVPFESEIHPDTQHGYMFPHRFCYDKTAADRSWDRIFSLFERRLRHRAL